MAFYWNDLTNYVFKSVCWFKLSVYTGLPWWPPSDWPLAPGGSLGNRGCSRTPSFPSSLPPILLPPPSLPPSLPPPSAEAAPTAEPSHWSNHRPRAGLAAGRKNPNYESGLGLWYRNQTASWPNVIVKPNILNAQGCQIWELTANQPKTEVNWESLLKANMFFLLGISHFVMFASNAYCEWMSALQCKQSIVLICTVVNVFHATMCAW